MRIIKDSPRPNKTFDSVNAQLFGLNEAILIDEICKVFGDYLAKQGDWLYIDLKDVQHDLLPFWALETVQKTMQSLVDQAIILQRTTTDEHGTYLEYALNYDRQPIAWRFYDRKLDEILN
jgi:hypothetical protein